MYRAIVLLFFVTFSTLCAGCVATGPQFSLTRDSGKPAGVPQPLPILLTPIGNSQSGAVVMKSDHYRTYFGANSIEDGFSKGKTYQTIGFTTALGAALQGSQK